MTESKNDKRHVDHMKPNGVQSFGLGLGLSGRMVFWIVLVPMLSTLVTGLICDQFIENNLQKKTEQTIKAVINQTSQDVETYFQEMKRQVSILAKRPSTRSLLESLSQGLALSGDAPDVYIQSKDRQRRLDQWRDHFELPDLWDYRDTLLIDPRGNVLYAMTSKAMGAKNIFQDMPGVSLLSKTCRSVLSSGVTAFSDYGIYTEGSEELILGYMVTQVMGENDRILGLVAVECDVLDLNGILARYEGLEQNVGMYLAGEDKLLRADSGTRKNRNTLKDEITSGLVFFPEPGARIHLDTYQNPDGDMVVGMSQGVRIGDVRYVLIGEIGKRDSFAFLYMIRKVFGYFFLIQWVVVMAAAYILSLRIVLPVTTMADWAAQVATGDLVLYDMDFSDDEMGLLIRHFSRMVAFLRETSALALSVASGDFNVNIEPRSGNDELGMALEQLTRSLREASVAMASLSGGDFDVKVKVKGPNDKFSKSINSMVEKIRLTHEATEKQAQLKSLQMELSKTIRGNPTIQGLGGKVLSFFCQALNMATGVFYRADSTGEVLRFISSYACSHPLPEMVPYGEGLLGQTASEKREIILDHCPDNYMEVRGQTGIQPVVNVLVFPFIHEGNLVGVMELGSLREFTGNELEFVSQVSESVAIAILSADSRMKMKELLDKTVKQAEDLRTNQEKLDGINRALQMKTFHLEETEAQLRKQESELRATNRDLIRQTELLRKSEKRLRIKEEELMAANAALEERSLNLEVQKNAIKQKNIELEAAQGELVEKSERLESSSRYKSEFLANMSHELRTPLNSILLISRLLAENKIGNLSEKQVEFARTVQSSGMDLLALIDDILDLSKIESGKLELQISRAPLIEMVEKIEAGFSPVCHEKGIGFTITVDERIPGHLYLDFQRTHQVIKNLVGNAIKFTTHGWVKVFIGLPDDLPRAMKKRLKREDTLLVSVRDTGVGIPKDKLTVIFEAFKQADGTISRQFGGTGLGLSISMQLVRMMDGDIVAESQPGVGSTFNVYLPHVFHPPDNISVVTHLPGVPEPPRVPTAPAVAPAASESGKPSKGPSPRKNTELGFGGKKIMIVDDDMRNVFGLLNYLEDYGMDIKVAKSGKESLAVLEKHPDVDLVVMDIMMPDMDGFEAMERIRAQERFKGLPLIALTAKAMKGDREKCMEAGASEYLSKPVDMDRLLMVMKRMLRAKSL